MGAWASARPQGVRRGEASGQGDRGGRPAWGDGVWGQRRASPWAAEEQQHGNRGAAAHQQQGDAHSGNAAPQQHSNGAWARAVEPWRGRGERVKGESGVAMCASSGGAGRVRAGRR